MSSLTEKLSILSEMMVAFARIDVTVKEPEYNFLLSVATQSRVNREAFDSLFDIEIEHIIPKS